MADDERRRVEKKSLELSRQTEDIQKQRDIAVDDHLTEVAVSHDLSMEKDRLKRELERVVKDHQREKEAMERDFDQRVNQEKLIYEKELQSERSKAADVKKTLNKQVEELKVEIVVLNEEVGRKTVEITKVGADHSEKLIENENRLKTEYEEKIKRMQVNHYQMICERELNERKLVEENITLKKDFDNLKNDHEKDLIERENEHKQAATRIHI